MGVRVIQRSCIEGCYSYPEVMYIWVLQLSRGHVYMGVIVIQRSCIYGC
jgi:hypothetical protein